MRNSSQNEQPWSIRLVVAWYDLWIGAYWDRARRRLYVLPIPCVGFVISFPRGPEGEEQP